jgi:hypothetical protein
MRRWLWVQTYSSTPFTAAKLEALLSLCQGRFSDLLFVARQDDDARSWFPSSLLRERAERIDGLLPGAWLVEQAAALGMKVHIWLYTGWAASYGAALFSLPAGWNHAAAYAGDSRCNPVNWIDYSLPAVRQMVADVCADWLVQTPGLAGIHLDYIRIHHLMSECPHILPAHITECIRQIRAAIGVEKELTVSISGNLSRNTLVRRDVPAWLSEAGLIDYALMMSYTSVPLADRLAYLATLPEADRVTPGVSTTDGIDSLQAQLAGWNAAGRSEFCVFDSYRLTSDMLALLPPLDSLPPEPPPPSGRRLRVAAVHRLEGTNLLYLDVEFLQDGQVAHRNDFIMQIPAGVNLSSTVLDNIRRYARRVDLGQVRFDRRGRFRLADAPPGESQALQNLEADL